jgi:hypothetical protein
MVSVNHAPECLKTVANIRRSILDGSLTLEAVIKKNP